MKELYSATSVEAETLSALRGITAKLIIGGFALRTSATATVHIVWSRMVTSSASMAVWTMIPAGEIVVQIKATFRSPWTDNGYYYACYVNPDGFVNSLIYVGDWNSRGRYIFTPKEMDISLSVR